MLLQILAQVRQSICRAMLQLPLGIQRNSGPSPRLRKRTSELGFMEECSPEHAASPLPLLLNTDGTRLPSRMRKSLKSCAQPWFNRSTSSESPCDGLLRFPGHWWKNGPGQTRAGTSKKQQQCRSTVPQEKQLIFGRCPSAMFLFRRMVPCFSCCQGPTPCQNSEKGIKRRNEEDVGKHSRMQRGELCPTFADMLTLDTC